MFESAKYCCLSYSSGLWTRDLCLTGLARRRRKTSMAFARSLGALTLAVALVASAAAAENGKERHFPLEPPDTSSPRATLKTFIDNVNEVYRLYRLEGLTYQNQALLQNLAPYIFGTLDLSQIPPTQLRSTGTTAAAQLKEVLDRIEVPPYEEIPDATGMKALVEAGEPPRWRIPHTEITIARIEEGPRQTRSRCRGRIATHPSGRLRQALRRQIHRLAQRRTGSCRRAVGGRADLSVAGQDRHRDRGWLRSGAGSTTPAGYRP